MIEELSSKLNYIKLQKLDNQYNLLFSPLLQLSASIITCVSQALVGQMWKKTQFCGFNGFQRQYKCIVKKSMFCCNVFILCYLITSFLSKNLPMK